MTASDGAADDDAAGSGSSAGFGVGPTWRRVM